MPAFAYVGNALDGAGLRLAGVQCWAPAPGDELAAFRQARAGAEAVFLAIDIAERLPRNELDTALAAGRPLLVLVPRPGEEPSALDPAERARAQLGLER
jgi:vacuolar-type H+-ATPase subunit F/Vma7